LEEIPNNDRYTFYLANSYRDFGDLDSAIETYRKRIEIGGWIEETWQCYYQIGKCYTKLGRMPDAIAAWMDAYHAYPNRVENLYEIINHYRVLGKNTLAYHFYLLAEESLRKYPERDHLFTQNDVYEYKLDYELSIIGYYCNKQRHDLVAACMKTIAHQHVTDGTYKNVLSNYKFYSPHVAQWGLPMHQGTLEALQTVGRQAMLPYLDEFQSSTPSLCWDDFAKTLIVCVRYVNYRIDDKGGYINGEHITTRNFIARFEGATTDPRIEWKKTDEAELLYDTALDGRYVGQEDVRLYWQHNGRNDGRGRILYNTNRGLEGAPSVPASHTNSHMGVEHGWIKYDTELKAYTCMNSKLLTYSKQRDTEKNWCLFRGADDTTQCVYGWSPLVIGTVCPNLGKFTETYRCEDGLPRFFKDVRCSTNGVKIGDEIWFIAHLVSYEDRRYYYHLMIVLDGASYALKRYSRLFRFEKDQKVEYTLGFVWFSESNRFLIGYSLMDRETKYVMLPRHIFDELWA
jgi:tetratricopeptide (TPR) repeat protein